MRYFVVMLVVVMAGIAEGRTHEERMVEKIVGLMNAAAARGARADSALADGDYEQAMARYSDAMFGYTAAALAYEALENPIMAALAMNASASVSHDYNRAANARNNAQAAQRRKMAQLRLLVEELEQDAANRTAPWAWVAIGSVIGVGATLLLMYFTRGG